MYRRSVDKLHQEGHNYRNHQDAKYQFDVPVVPSPWPPRSHVLISSLTRTQRTYATSWSASLEYPPPLGRMYRKSRPCGLGSILLLATLWGSLRLSQRILAGLRRLRPALLTRGCAG